MQQYVTAQLNCMSVLYWVISTSDFKIILINHIAPQSAPCIPVAALHTSLFEFLLPAIIYTESQSFHFREVWVCVCDFVKFVYFLNNLPSKKKKRNYGSWSSSRRKASGGGRQDGQTRSLQEESNKVCLWQQNFKSRPGMNFFYHIKYQVN